MISIADINGFSDDAFVTTFGFLFEHSPWVVEAAALKRPFADLAAMEEAMMSSLAEEGENAVLAVLRAHPELGGRALLEKTLTASSTAEQAGAGLNSLTAQEVQTFTALNTEYKARFGFPFIICVRMTNKEGIVRAMQQRLGHSRAEEIRTATDEVGKIVHLRLQDLCA